MRWMTRLLCGVLTGILVAIGCAGATPPPLPQDAANCDSPTYASDMLVCGDPELSALDRKMRSALAASDWQASIAPAARIESQDAWFKRRSLCAFSERHASCLKAAYAERIAVLDALRRAASVQPRQIARATCRGAPWGNGPVRGRALDAGPLLIQNADGKVLAVATDVEPHDDWSAFVRFTIEGKTVRLEPLGLPAIACQLRESLSAYGDPHTPIAGKVLGMVIHTRDGEELRYVILQRLTDRYAEEKGIVVTQAEKDAYVKQVQGTLERDRAQHALRRDELTHQLANAGLSQAERKALESQLAAENDFLAALAGDPDGDSGEAKAARDEVAAAFIRQWKINRALYQQYGGRVIFQQGGPEPLDAYRKFLDEQRARGDFVIVNERLEGEFWKYYRTDAMHSFYPVGSKEEAEVLDTPPWLSR